MRGLESLRAAARSADEARVAAERSRTLLSTATAACDAVAARSVRVAALLTQVPEQNSGPRRSTCTCPTTPRCSTRSTPPAARGTPGRPRHRSTGPAAGSCAASWPGCPTASTLRCGRSRSSTGRPSTRPRRSPLPARPRVPRPLRPTSCAGSPTSSPHPPAATVDVPAADGPQLAGLTSDLEAAEARHRDATAAAAAADQEAAAAADRYERMRAAAPIAGGRRSSKAAGRLKALALTILGVGVGLAALYFGLLAAFVFSAIVILPVVVSLLAAVVVAVRAMRRATGRRTGQPLVEDLVGAIVVVREKKAAAARAQEEAHAAEQHLTECRARRDAALRGERPDPAREQALDWCLRHGLRADPAALRALAERSPTAVGVARRGAVAVRGGGRPDRRRAAGGAARARDPRRGLTAGAVRPVRGTGRRHEHPARGAGAGPGGAHGRGGGRGGRGLRTPGRGRAAALGGRRGRPGHVGRAGGAGDGARRVARHPDRGAARSRWPSARARPSTCRRTERPARTPARTMHVRDRGAGGERHGPAASRRGRERRRAGPRAGRVARRRLGRRPARPRGGAAGRARRAPGRGLGRGPGRVRGPAAPRRARLRGGRRPGPRG